LPACKDGSFHRLEQEVNAAVKAALAKAPPTTVPILMRDQSWFREMIGAVIDDAAGGGDDQLEVQKRTLDNVVATLHQRIATLHAIAQGFGRTGVAGRWTNAFGTSNHAGRTEGYRIVLSGKQATAGPPKSAANVRHRCGGALRCQRMLSGKVVGSRDVRAQPRRWKQHC
jgi:hypothetical protein